MKLHGNRIRNIASVLVMLAASCCAWAKGLEDFSLTKAIPADVFVAIHTRGHEGQAWLNKQYARVGEELEKIHLERDVKLFFKKMAKEQGHETEEFDENWNKVADMLSTVEWFHLADREYAFCMRLGEILPEFISLMKPPADKVDSNFEGMAGMLKHLAELQPEAFVLATDTQGDLTTHRLSVNGAPFPVVLTLAKHKDVIAIGFGPTLVEQSLALLTGKEGKTLASTPRFQEAFKKVAAPTDAAAFVDAKVLFTQLRTLVDHAIAMSADAAPKEGEPGYEDYVRGKQIPGKIFDMCDITEYSATVRTTDGMKATGESVTMLREDAKNKALYKVMYGNPAIKNPLGFVPKEAGDFFVTSGINLKALYEAIVKMLKEDIPQGEEVLAGIDGLKENGFDIEKDLIAWIQGSMVMVSKPGPNAYASSDWVFMLQVSDEAKCKEQVDRLVKMGEEALAGSQQGSIADAQIDGAEGFKTLNIQMLSMMGGGLAPTFGVAKGWLVAGSSAKFIEKTLATIAGGENISKNERFTKEGLMPEGAVHAIAFTDESNLGENLSTALGMLPMLTMTNPELGKNPVLSSLIGIAGKLSRVVRKLDFFQSSASVTTIDGNVVHTKSLSTYREPPPPPKKPTAESKEKSENEESGKSEKP
ncbi:MAG: DUF3352 domain-containing protein [Planctomycetes bacterium]|nr:DUF3352 domain-containing protein [Planctomycetota bacterium]